MSETDSTNSSTDCTDENPLLSKAQFHEVLASKQAQGTEDYLDRDAEECASKAGLILVKDQDWLLLCDLDTPEQEDQFYRATESDFAHVVEGLKVTRSKSGKKHAYVRLFERQPLGVRLALQAQLGSDPVRGKLDLLRILNELDTEKNCLFETAEEHEKLSKFLALGFWRDWTTE